MSHFTVLVALPKETPLEGVEEALEKVLAPYSENLEVEPYREYLDEATPAEHWQYKYVYEDSKALAADAAPITWEQYAADFTRHNADETPMLYDAELGKAYHMTRYNPLSKWDWYQVGGRWSNALLAKSSVDLSALLWSPSHWTEEHGNHIPKGRDAGGRYHCNGGRLMDLDLEAMEETAVAEATEAYDHFASTIGEHLADTKPWVHFFGLAQAGEYDEQVAKLNATALVVADAVPAGDDPLGLRTPRDIFPRDLARQAYNAQPGIVRLHEHERYKHSFGCVIDKFALGREEYIERARRNFLPGYAMVTLDGQWLASGEMGWFGMGSDEPGTVDAFKTEAKAYLRGIDQESIVVLVDCHI